MTIKELRKMLAKFPDNTMLLIHSADAGVDEREGLGDYVEIENYGRTEWKGAICLESLNNEPFRWTVKPDKKP